MNGIHFTKEVHDKRLGIRSRKGIDRELTNNYSELGFKFGHQEDILSSSEHQEINKKAIVMMDNLVRYSKEQVWIIQRTRFLLLTWGLRIALLERLKRIFDIFVASLTLICTSPLFLITAIAIKLDSSGPIFFRQERVGKWGELFECYKFRSMYINAEQRKAELMALNEADEIVFKMKEDPRITRVGRIIRKLSIDELPQLINVLQGEMSLVGPRPPIPIEVVQYSYDQFKRLEVTPGITGLQQISGRSDLDFKRWIELDLEYVHSQSVLQDIIILLKTIPTVFSRKGAY